MCISTPRSSLVVRFLSVFLLCCTSLYASVDQTGKQKVTVVGTDVTLETVFRQIEKQTGLRFMYAVDAVDVKEKVTVMFEKVMLDEVLESLLGKKGIEWVYREGVISLKMQLKKSVNTTVDADSTQGPQITISGKVLDVLGMPIPGATVLVKGTRKGTKTDANGNFTLAGNSGMILVISSVGFETKEMKGTTSPLVVHMSVSVNTLDETVIKGGYYSTTRRYNIGNAVTITSEDIEKQPVSDPLLALQGRVPGMIITQTTGLQGGEVKVQIRGRNSLNSGVVPLFIIDGMPYSPSITAPAATSFGALGNVISALNFINPRDIETIDVLKDADATAIYGSRGANGVVLITTKRGKIGKTKVDLNVYKGWGDIARKRKMMNTPEYLKMRHEAFRNDMVTPSADRFDIGYAPDLMLWDTTRYTDWQKELLGGSAAYTDMQASVSGGTTNVQYLVGGNFHKETTVYPGDFSSKNGGGHFNITGVSGNQKMKTALTGSYSIRGTNFPGVDFARDISLPPNAPKVFDTYGRLNWENSTWENPYAKLKSQILNAHTSNLVNSINVSYTLIPGLTALANLGYNELWNDNFSARTIAGLPPEAQATGSAFSTFMTSKSRGWNFEPQVSYNVNIGPGSANLLAGATMLGTKSEQQTIITFGIKDDALVRNPAAGSGYFVRSAGTKYKYLAFFGRASYNLKDRYLMNLTVRRDGSSRFGPRKQFATFGSIAAGWIFSEESFVKSNLSFLSYGKVRMSYGTTGNDQITDYGYLDRYDFQNLEYQGTKGLAVVGIFNSDFSWELTKKAEVGLEMGFIHDRIFLSSSYYRNRSSRQLIGYPLPSITGASNISGNLPAVIQNAGLEFLLTSKNISRKNFEWTSSFNLSANRNKLVSYTGLGFIYAKVGKSISTVEVNKLLGVDPKSGTYIFSDNSGKPTSIDGAARIASVDINPVFLGGFQNTFRIKSFQVDILLQYVKQKGVNGIFDPQSLPGQRKNQSEILNSSWHREGDISSYQKFNQNFELAWSYLGMLASDKGFEDASFIRCKNVSLSWQVPSRILKTLKIPTFRLYAQGQNLFTITKYSGWDPETQSVSSIPPLRVMTFGLQISF